jgi:glycosyltransferase involved in cell wall biosynthesis
MWTLSVCIPIYNTDVRALVNDLCTQIDALPKASINIVLIDDASAPKYTKCNVFTQSYVQSILLAENIGRSRIRNAFLNYSDADYLLFIDGDSTIEYPLFLKKYVDYLTQKPTEVLVGASVYQSHKPARSMYLRWSYSTQRESLDYHKRTQNQHVGFKTNNFVIRRSVLQQIPFDEKLTGYGHEDTLLGLRLAAQKIHIDHIDNPVFNLKLDTNTEFLSKTDSALTNLLWLAANHPTLHVADYNRLLQLHLKLKQHVFLKYFMGRLTSIIPFLVYLLKTGYAPLMLFDLYRLLRLQQLNKNALHNVY